MEIDRFGLFVTTWMCLFLAIVLSFILPILFTGSVSMMVFIEGFVVSFAISLVISLVLPLMQWGGMAAAACGAKPDTLPWHFVSTALLSLIMATILSLVMVFYFMPPEARSHFLYTWISAYPFVLLGTYVSALIAAPIGVAIAKKCCGVP